MMQPSKPPAQGNSFTWETIFIVMLAVNAMPHARAVDAEAAHNVAIYRGVITLIGIVGLAFTVWRKKQMVQRPAVPDTAVSASHSDRTNGQQAFCVRYHTNRTTAWRMESWLIVHNSQALSGLLTLIFFPSLSVLIGAWNKDPVNAIGKGIIVSLLLTVLFAAIFAFMMKKRYPTPQSVRNCTTFISPSGIHDVLPDKTNYFSWTDIKEIKENNGDLYFNVNCCIPGEAFETRESAVRFVEASRLLWKSKGTSLPSSEIYAEFPVTETPSSPFSVQGR